jgi:pimeloyl-ACP methyl ester carboxylesterase
MVLLSSSLRVASVVLVGVVALGVSSGCFNRRTPALDLIYNASARFHAPDRKPVIAIPGIMGSRLRLHGSDQLVWGAFEPSSANPEEPDGARAIALPIRNDAELRDIRDDVEPDGVLERLRVRLLGIPLQVQAYAGILQTLGAGGYRDEALGLGGKVDYGDDHFTCFQFDYDWRRDNVENAKRLHDFILEKRAQVRVHYRERFGIDQPDIRFDIVAHSMGGLITRYFLMYGDQDLPRDGSLPKLTWAGAEFVERVILVGTPNAGSVDALVQLVEGMQLAPLLPYYPSALIGTFPSTYQLLPRARHAPVLWDGDPGRPVDDLLDPELWKKMEWGLASPAQARTLAILMPEVDDPARRREIALGYQNRVLARVRAFQAALDRPAKRPPHLGLMLVAGDAEGTARQLALDSSNGSLRLIGDGPGDGTVLRESALMDERPGSAWQPQVVTPIDWSTVLFLPENHLGLTTSPIFRDNVLYWLLEAPRTSATSP